MRSERIHGVGTADGVAAVERQLRRDIRPAPTPLERVKELLVEKFGWGGCKHAFIVVTRRDRMYLRCTKCPHETEGFRVAGRSENQEVSK